MGEAFDIVRSGYARIGVWYREWSSASPTRLVFVQRLLRELTPGCLVVELGCGPGEPATRLLAAEHRVLAVGASLTQLRLAREAAPTAALVQVDIAQLNLRAENADAVTSFYALAHLSSHEHALLFHTIAQWLRPGGVLLTSAPLGSGDDRDESWLGVPMYFGVGKTSTRAAIESAELAGEEWETVPEDEGDGKVVRFLWVLARANPAQRLGRLHDCDVGVTARATSLLRARGLGFHVLRQRGDEAAMQSLLGHAERGPNRRS